MNRKLALCRWPLLVIGGSLGLPVALAGACSTATRDAAGTSAGHGGSSSTVTATATAATASSSSSSGTGGGGITIDAPGCPPGCTPDLHAVVDCTGQIVQTCAGTDGCDAATGTCANACQVTAASKQSVGCEYYATDMDMDAYGAAGCFAAFVANTWNTPAHILADFAGSSLSVASFTGIPSGSGPMLTYAPYDPTAGLAPGEVAILFLAGRTDSNVPCPLSTATATGGQLVQQTGVGSSFHITTDVPVVAYQANPFGGGKATITGASLLLPVSVWGDNYVAVTAAPASAGENPSLNIIAAEDNTQIAILPTVAITGGGQLAAGPANVPYQFTLDQGQQAQFTQSADLTGSIVLSSKPVGFMAGQPCMSHPLGVPFCDHGEQMVPPVRALGNEYAGVMFRPRVPGDQATWRLVGTVPGTQLSYSTNVGGPAALTVGQVAEFTTDQPFVVQSQDPSHPFLLFTLMTGSHWSQLSNPSGYGDPDFVISVPPQQYLTSYVFFADPSFPETNLVVVRVPNAASSFDDVVLDCAGPLTGWQPVGGYEWTRIDLMSHNFAPQGKCSTGGHTITSKSPFGLWVWGWGTPETTPTTENVSYGYPGGMRVQPINQVIINTQ